MYFHVLPFKHDVILGIYTAEQWPKPLLFAVLASCIGIIS